MPVCLNWGRRLRARLLGSQSIADASGIQRGKSWWFSKYSWVIGVISALYRTFFANRESLLWLTLTDHHLYKRGGVVIGRETYKHLAMYVFAAPSTSAVHTSPPVQGCETSFALVAPNPSPCNFYGEGKCLFEDLLD